MQTADVEQQKLVEGAMDAYFEAMLAGWLNIDGNSEMTEILTATGYVITTRVGDFTVVDRHNAGGGTVTISLNNKPIWRMNYTGRYPLAVVPFLKQALQEMIKVKQFVGGRGPEIFLGSGGLIYKNEAHGDFASFFGAEVVCDARGLIGSHEYAGSLLI